MQQMSLSEQHNDIVCYFLVIVISVAQI